MSLQGSVGMFLGTRRKYSPVETQNFAENQYQHHTDKDARLLHVGPDSFVSDDADSVARRHAREAHRQSACEMHETPALYGQPFIPCLVRENPNVCNLFDDDVLKQTVMPPSLARRPQILRYQHRNDEAVHGDDTRHDDGDQALHDQIRPEGAHTRDADARLGRAERGADAFVVSLVCIATCVGQE